MKEILDCLETVINTTGLIAKKEVLGRFKDNEEMIIALNLAFNPFKITGIAKKKLNKEVEVVPVINKNEGRKSLLGASTAKKEEVINYIDTNFKSLANFFLNHNTGRDSDIKSVQAFINKCIKEHNLTFSETKILEDIITKDLTLGLNVKSINEVYGKVIQTFSCMLGVKLEGVEDSLVGKKVTVTEKLDGNRCLAVVKQYENQENNDIYSDVTFYSRNGKPIEGLDDIREVMKDLPEGVYDGELLADDFNDTQSTLRTKGNKKGLVYNIFDFMLKVNEFFDDNLKEVSEPYHLRRVNLEDLFLEYGDANGQYIGANKCVKKVEVLYSGIYDNDIVMQLHDEIKAKGGEGVMINVEDSNYIKDRTKNLVKVKAMKTCDIPCIAIENGDGRLANTLGYIICDYKGYEVKVGSGFDDGSRDYYYHNPDKIINHIVEVQYFEETTNQDGTVSLRFPVFLQVRSDKEEVSYE